MKTVAVISNILDTRVKIKSIVNGKDTSQQVTKATFYGSRFAKYETHGVLD